MITACAVMDWRFGRIKCSDAMWKARSERRQKTRPIQSLVSINCHRWLLTSSVNKHLPLWPLLTRNDFGMSADSFRLASDLLASLLDSSASTGSKQRQIAFQSCEKINNKSFPSSLLINWLLRLQTMAIIANSFGGKDDVWLDKWTRLSVATYNNNYLTATHTRTSTHT